MGPLGARIGYRVLFFTAVTVTDRCLGAVCFAGGVAVGNIGGVGVVKGRSHRILDGDVAVAIGIRNQGDTLRVGIQLAGNIVHIVEDIARINTVGSNSVHLGNAVFRCLQVLQRANQRMVVAVIAGVGGRAQAIGFGTDVAEDKVLAAEPVAFHHIGTALIVVVQRADLHTVDVQIHHISLSRHPVHQRVAVTVEQVHGCRAAVVVKEVVGGVTAVAFVHAAADDNAVVGNDDMGRIQRIGGAGGCHQHKCGIVALAAADSALPFDGPGLIVQQYHRLAEPEAGLVQRTVGIDGACEKLEGIFRQTLAGDSSEGAVRQLPAEGLGAQIRIQGVGDGNIIQCCRNGAGAGAGQLIDTVIQTCHRQFLGPVQGVHHRYHGLGLGEDIGIRLARQIGVAVPSVELDGLLNIRLLIGVQPVVQIPGSLAAHLVVADLVIVDGILYIIHRLGHGQGAGLDGIVYAVRIAGLKESLYRAGAVLPGDPIVTDITDHMDILICIRIAVCHIILRNTGTGHFQIVIVRIIGFRSLFIGLAVGIVRAAATDKDHVGALQRTLAGSAAKVIAQVLLELFVHGGEVIHIPVGSLDAVGAALTPEVTHIGQGIVAGSDLLVQGLLGCLEQRHRLLIITAGRHPCRDAGAALRGIDQPDLLAGILCPFVGKAAVDAVLAVAISGQRVQRVGTHIGSRAVHRHSAVITGKGRGHKAGCITHGQRPCKAAHIVVTAALAAIGGVDLSVSIDDRFRLVALRAGHITLADHQEQGNGSRFYGNLMELVTDDHLCGADTGGNELVCSSVILDDRNILGTLGHTVAHLIGGRCAGIEHLHRLSGQIQTVVILHGDGIALLVAVRIHVDDLTFSGLCRHFTLGVEHTADIQDTVRIHRNGGRAFVLSLHTHGAVFQGQAVPRGEAVIGLQRCVLIGQVSGVLLRNRRQGGQRGVIHGQIQRRNGSHVRIPLFHRRIDQFQIYCGNRICPRTVHPQRLHHCVGNRHICTA